ncbi:MAG: hypothetical protein PUF72_00125, partial [Clostridiales bacterium]|nr:hypothetical protein [Clostridiales bacterium]
MITLFKYIKEKRKFIVVALIISILMSLYISLELAYFIQYKTWGLNVFSMLPHISMKVFAVCCIFCIIAILIAIFKNVGQLEKDERNFKYSESGVYGTAGFLKEEDLNGYAIVSSPQQAWGTILGQMDMSNTKVIAT